MKSCENQKGGGPARCFPWITGAVTTAVGPIPRVGTRLTLRDELGALRVRLAVGRMNYSVPPQLYAVGNPTADSPVFVTANYKLSFDFLRSALGDIHCWILVLDTGGINVWCAAGKGTFGTEELVRRVQTTRLADVVTHRKLIVPQLGAPGVAAHEVQKRCGFQVLYGPVRAEDLPEFVTAEFQATPAMRHVRFSLRDRMAVAPVELVLWFKYALGLSVLLALACGVSRHGFRPAKALQAIGLVFTGWLAGGLLVPALLPWLPGRAFAIKGLWVALALWPLLNAAGACGSTLSSQIGSGLILAAILSFMALNFTGATPCTSMSGVKKEMALAIPLQLLALLAGAAELILGGHP
jgi:hypothetical protein